MAWEVGSRTGSPNVYDSLAVHPFQGSPFAKTTDPRHMNTRGFKTRSLPKRYLAQALTAAPTSRMHQKMDES